MELISPLPPPLSLPLPLPILSGSRRSVGIRRGRLPDSQHALALLRSHNPFLRVQLHLDWVVIEYRFCYTEDGPFRRAFWTAFRSFQLDRLVPRRSQLFCFLRRRNKLFANTLNR